MDKVLRFSDYDVFAYIVSGLAIMLIWDLMFGTHWIISAQWTVSEGVAILSPRSQKRVLPRTVQFNSSRDRDHLR